MSDETAPDVNQDSPATLETEPEVDWRKRFEDTQAEFTRSRQTLSDEEALMKHISENFPHLLAEEAEDEDFDNDPDLRDDDPEPQAQVQAPEDYDEVRAWVAAQQYQQDLQRFAGNRELTDDAREAIEDWSRAGGHTPQALEKAVNRWFKLFPPPEPEVEEKPAKKKTVPVPTGGQTATGTPDFGDMTEDQINQWMVEKARSLDTQS